MSLQELRFIQRFLSDRFGSFEAISQTESGEQIQEEYVAFGDGKTLPFRSFMRKELFELAKPYLLSPESTVTAIDTNRLAGLTGAMLARQSRITGTILDVLVDEFLVKSSQEAEKLDLPIGSIKAKKLDQIIERILLQYGDDSVQELEYATVLFNSVSNIATKIIEDRRLGGFIEQSSRYVVYSQRDPVSGHWFYLREHRIMESPHADLYIKTMDACFELYVKLVDKLTNYYQSIKPSHEAVYAIRPDDSTKYHLNELSNEKEKKEFLRAYGFDLRCRACDVARIILPASTLTNVAMVANGRVFEHLLKRLYSSSNPEFHDIATRLHETLNKQIPKYVKRASPGGETYWKEMDQQIISQIQIFFPEFLTAVPSSEEVKWVHQIALLEDSKEAIASMLATQYFPHVHWPFDKIVYRLLQESKEHLTDLLKAIVSKRSSRRDRSHRGFEHGYPCTFEVVGNYGIFRDLHRHRMLTQQRQYLNPHLGFTIPADIIAIGMEEEVNNMQKQAAYLFDQVVLALGSDAAQYTVLFGHHIRFMMGFNLREAQHLLELRTIAQGHPDYRRICQKMDIILKEKAPWLSQIGLLQFVDYNDYPWARADAEARQSSKRLRAQINEEDE
ncbi:hypothetical protein CO172_00360 [Candidatus Uhrbacteria bacterium CG_4_9_14_3_um_filter_36_7]|uniref:Thymidylate synthase n=1 Tax=Candidatus Uhrbacteria bacterium CG_4_9_14_3_um_filter_36_7 TaxID=1975033 RepID=A0A2M7XIE0_9BACT|nr:MAG: hypothetical protein CO172_00360 [Candidatus Uhrbacteria bacterium CG_4_9_14_3_um_filter_36_7]